MRYFLEFMVPHKSASVLYHNCLSSAPVQQLAPVYLSTQKECPIYELKALDGFVSAEKSLLFIKGPTRGFYPYSMDELLLFANRGIRPIMICIVRDPLDIAISQYFSHGWIHDDSLFSQEEKDFRQLIQSRAITLYEYVVRSIFDNVAFGRQLMLNILDLKALERQALSGVISSITLRYERMIADPASFLADFCSFLGGYLPKHSVRVFRDSLALELYKSDKEVISVEHGAVLEALLCESNGFPIDAHTYVEKLSSSIGFRHIRGILPGQHKYFLSRREIGLLRDKINKCQEGLGFRYL